MPALAKPAAPPPAPKAAAEPRRPAVESLPRPWTYVMTVDHGVRADLGGKGGFLAPRTHGRHNGLDLLAPMGTPVMSPCDGPARSGVSGSHGKWVQVVCNVPKSVLPSGAFVSFFYSHLSEIKVKKQERVRSGEHVGAVGKSGNASGAKIAPHLHLELIVHDDLKSALAERHSGRDQSDTAAAKNLMKVLEARCFEPTGLERKHGATRRNRRPDPFLVLTCLSRDRPALSDPPAALRDLSEPWSEHYQAQTFDVDKGSK